MAAPDPATGTYVYDEADAAAPFSTMLNKLGTSVKNALVQLQNRMLAAENKLGNVRLQTVTPGSAQTASGAQIAVIAVNRTAVALRVLVTIAGSIVPTNATTIAINTTIDAPGTAQSGANHVVNSAASSNTPYASVRSFNIPAGTGTITIRFVLGVGAGTAAPSLEISAQTFIQGEF